jgi:TPR repeat protein
MRESFAEYSSAADVDLELLFRDIRWRYTRYREQPPDLKAADVEALGPELDHAERAGNIGARMLLGEHLSTRKDWPKAIEHYERARDRAPKATTRIGLLYARFSNDPAELAKAWQYFQAAHEAGDLDGKIAVAECLIHGTFRGADGDKLVPGLKANEESGVKLLREIIATAPSRREPAELANAQLAETYVSEPNRSKLVLGNYYFKQEQPGAVPPAWYRAETIDHAREMRSLLDEAKEDWSDAYGLLGVADILGIGAKPNPTTAAAHFEQGVAKQNVLSIYNYAVFLSQSAPPGKIPDKAKKLFVQAAEKGHAEAIKRCEEQKLPFKRPAPP